MTGFLYQTLGGITNVLLASMFAILLSNSGGQELYAEYSILLSGYFAINLISGLGLSSYLQFYLSKSIHLTLGLVFNVVVIKSIFVSLIYVIYSIYNNKFDVSLLAYILMMIANQLIIDSAFTFKSKFNIVFYSRFSINILRIISIYFSESLEILIFNLLICEFVVLIVIVIACFINSGARGRRGILILLFRMKSLSSFKFNFTKTVYTSNIIFYFSTPAFIISYMNYVGYGLSDIASFSMIASLGILLFSMLNLNSRFEGALVSMFIRGDDISTTQITLTALSSALMSIVLASIILNYEIISILVFSGEYTETLPLISYVYILSITSLISYNLSPYIYYSGKLWIFRRANIIASLSIFVLIFNFEKNTLYLFIYLALYGVIRLITLLVLTYQEQRDIIKITIRTLFKTTSLSFILAISLYRAMDYIWNPKNLLSLTIYMAFVSFTILIICGIISKMKINDIKNIKLS